jgi:hypothetical protein
VEWSSRDRQDVAIPWTAVEDAATARRFAERLMRAPRPIPGYTSISGAIDFSAGLLAAAPFVAARRVIDISGNGVNNDGRPAVEARDAAVPAGVTVNGLPLLDLAKDLDAYYATNVIGGPRAFMVVARDLESFSEAVLKKLTVEVAAAAAVGATDRLSGARPGRAPRSRQAASGPRRNAPRGNEGGVPWKRET